MIDPEFQQEFIQALTSEEKAALKMVAELAKKHNKIIRIEPEANSIYTACFVVCTSEQDLTEEIYMCEI